MQGLLEFRLIVFGTAISYRDLLKVVEISLHSKCVCACQQNNTQTADQYSPHTELP